MKLQLSMKPGATNREETVIPGGIYQIVTREPTLDNWVNIRATELLAAASASSKATPN